MGGRGDDKGGGCGGGGGQGPIVWGLFALTARLHISDCKTAQDPQLRPPTIACTIEVP